MKVIGITGTIASGKEVVKDFLQQKFTSYYVSLSSVIRAEEQRKKKDFNRKSLQDFGNEMRKNYGTHILAKMGVEYLPRERELIIVDGIRNPGEAEWLKKTFGKNFFLIGVDAPQEIRWQRVQTRERQTDPKTFEEFIALDKRDQGEGEPEYGQQVGKCMSMCDFVIQNDDGLEVFQEKLKDVAQKLY